MANFMARQRGQHREARQRGQHWRPDSVADFMARQRGQHREARQHGRHRRTSSVADLKACELRGRLQGPPAAWPTCDPSRRRPSVSTTSKIPRPVSCVADFRGPRARVADIKARQLRGPHKGAGAEVEEARAGRPGALPAPSTRHPRGRSRTANTRRAREGQGSRRRGKSGVCASLRQFLLQDDVSSGLSTRRLDPRRRRAETGFAAGLD